MEDIWIPKLSVLMTYDQILSDVGKFCAVTGFKPDQPILKHTSPVEKKHRESGLPLTRLMRALRNSVLSKVSKDYDMIVEEYDYTFLPQDLHHELREKKNVLLSVIKQHESAILKLREARMTCWNSLAKIDKYTLITSTQKSALLHNEDQRKERLAALKDMEKALSKWEVEHKNNCVKFEIAFLKEINLREKLVKISHELKTTIYDRINDAIYHLMERHNVSMSSTELKKLSIKLYQQAFRSYSFQIVENDPCKKDWIEIPTYRKCEWKQQQFVAKMVVMGMKNRNGQRGFAIAEPVAQTVA